MEEKIIKNKKMRYAKIFASFFCVALAAVIGFFANATISPQVYFEGDPTITKTDYNPGDKITGSVNLWNAEEGAMGDLTFKYQLFGMKIEEVPAQLLDEARDIQTFSLSASEKIVKQFSYTLPANLPNGKFTFRVQLATGRGEELAWSDKEINVTGGGKFLFIDNEWIVKDGENLDSGGGVYYQPGEAASVTFDVANNTKESISGYYRITNFVRNTGGAAAGEEKKDVVTVAAGKKQTVKTELPKIAAPETYLSEIRFFDAATNQPISNTVYFRWIISGENAKVVFMQPDKDAYTAGEQANVMVAYTGSADSEIDLGTGMVEVRVLDKTGNIVGTATKEISLAGVGGEVSVAVPVQQNINDPKIVATITKNSKKLDSYSYGIESDNRVAAATATTDAAAEKAAEEEAAKKAESEKNTSIMITVIVVIIGIAAAVFFIKKGKKGAKPAAMAIIIAASLLSGNEATAATEVAKGIGDTTITFNKPTPGQTFVAGTDIAFSGKFNVTSCGNGLFHNRVTFYITEDKDIPFIDSLGVTRDTYSSKTLCNSGDCINCYGASSPYIQKNYKVSNCKSTLMSAKDAKGNPYTYNTFMYGDNVKDLDMTKGYKIYKLGSVYPGDALYISGQKWKVEFDKTYTIPQDLGFYGPVRLYVVYSGTHWISHWHWNITYQKATILGGPEVTSPAASQPDYCKSEPTATFTWGFDSETPGTSQSAFQIQIANDSNFTSMVHDTGKINPNFTSYTLKSGILAYNKTYNWRIKIWDNRGIASDWSAGQAFTTPNFQAPQVNMGVPRSSLAPGESVNFVQDDPKAASYCYSSGTKKLCQNTTGVTYLWNYGDGETSAIKGNTSHIYQKEGKYTATLKITDNSVTPAVTCEKTKELHINKNRPADWSEGAPE